MGRVADSTIKGFMYQFNLSLNEILKSDDEIIMLEGIIEDIDKIGSSELTAIQCKYHESVDKFKWSIVYKPILQMLKTYTQGSVSGINFVLYAFFPGEENGEKEITVDKIEEMLNTNNSDYICDYVAYIKKPKNQNIEELVKKERKSKEDKAKITEYYKTNQLEISCDLEEFVKNRFTFYIGSSYNDLTKENKELLRKIGFAEKDIEDLVYPNAIQKIATLSMLKDDDARNITKEEMISELSNIKKTAITRWTKELANFKNLLTQRRRQMSISLNANYRKRCLIFKPEDIENFDDEIVIFINDYVSKYCTKIKLHIPAIICILGYGKDKIDDLVARLYKKGIEVESGFRGSEFYIEAFNKEPQKNIQKGLMEFRIKICGDECECINAINYNKQDDILLFTDELPEKLSVQDVNVELLNVQTFDQVEYLLKLKDEVEI